LYAYFKHKIEDFDVDKDKDKNKNKDKDKDKDKDVDEDFSCLAVVQSSLRVKRSNLMNGTTNNVLSCSQGVLQSCGRHCE